MLLDIAQIGDPVLRDVAPEVPDLVEDPLTMYTWQEFDKHHEGGFREQVEQLVTRYGSRGVDE